MRESADFDSLGGVLRRRARSSPQLTAFTFLGGEGSPTATLTYEGLDARARDVARALRQAGARPGDRALLLFPTGPEFVGAFFGCLYAGVVPAPAPDPSGSPRARQRATERIEALVADARAAFVLTTEVNVERFGASMTPSSILRSARWMAVDRLAPGCGHEELQPHRPGRDEVAFLQYTSGSTSAPKGVMVSHGNLAANLADLDLRYQHGPSSTMVSWLPIFHDMGLIYGIFMPLYRGFRCYLMTPEAFIAKPVRWLEAISRYHGTHSAAPNFAYDLCVRKTTPSQRQTLDLRSWAVAANGAEPVNPATLVRFSEAFEGAGFRPSAHKPNYGLAEATLEVTCLGADDPVVLLDVDAGELRRGRVVVAEEHADGATRTLVGCGRVAPDATVRIVDPHTQQLLADDAVGEIWISGPSVARGYWRQPRETRRTFGARVTGSREGPFLRSGDLGFVHDGQLFVVGRHKDIIIVRGQNYAPRDLERTAQDAHPAIRPGCVAAFDADERASGQVVIVAELDRAKLKAREAAVAERVARAIAREHGLAVHDVRFLEPRTLPKTSSGKVRRSACRADYRRSASASTPCSVWAPAPVAHEGTPSMSLMFFSSHSGDAAEGYRLVLDAARSAEALGLEAVWIPERHFHRFGGLYPNPSVLAAAIANATSTIRIRAGSVVLPLHDPVRVAEEWAVVDQLSGGRVDLAFAVGWNPDDFVLAPEAYEERRERMFTSIDTIDALWRGETITRRNGEGAEVAVGAYPRPAQPQIPRWLTCASSPERFVDAGERGFNLLTALLFLEVDDVARNIRLYREARARAGHGPGHVTLMMHTFVDATTSEARRIAQAPLERYLESSVDLWRRGSVPLEELSEQERARVLAYAAQRYMRDCSLVGGLDRCAAMLEKVRRAGVDEVACLVDFGVDRERVLGGLEHLARLRGSRPLGVSPAAVERAHDTNERARSVSGVDAGAGSVVSREALSVMEPDEKRRALTTLVRAQLERSVDGVDLDSLDDTMSFPALGIDSVAAAELGHVLSEALGKTVPAAAMFEHPSVRALVEFALNDLEGTTR